MSRKSLTETMQRVLDRARIIPTRIRVERITQIRTHGPVGVGYRVIADLPLDLTPEQERAVHAAAMDSMGVRLLSDPSLSCPRLMIEGA